MSQLEQLAALIELLDSPVHADAETHDSEHGACTECPVPLFSRPPLEIAQAIINAGWTPPPQQTSTCQRDGMGICKHCGNGINIRHIINDTEPPCPGKTTNN